MSDIPEESVKLSVAMVTYNHEIFIRQAIESVLAQRVNFEFQVVVGEDCSTDATRSVLMELHDRYTERIVPVLQQQNIRMVRNLCSTLAACRGEYVAIIEGDDYWTSEDKLQKQVDFLDKHPDYSICCHRVQIRDDAGAGREGISPILHFHAGSYTIGDIIAFNFIPNISVVYRANSIRPFPESFLELPFCDWPLHIFAASSGKIHLMDDVMAVHRMHAGGMFNSRKSVDQKMVLIPQLEAVDRHLNLQYSDAIARTIASLYLGMAIIERLNGNRTATLKYLLASFRNCRLDLVRRWRVIAALLVYSVLGIRRVKGSDSAPHGS
jgi:glycosyltransferase involved in cell wall biosynthesis